MKICVVTSHEAGEPRGLRHAVAAKRAFPDAEVIFKHYRAASASPAIAPPQLAQHQITTRPLTFPTRRSDPLALARRKITSRLERVLFRCTGIIREGVFGERTQGLTRDLLQTPADCYLAHNIETLLPAARAAQHWDATLVFDCMEFYRDMGDGQLSEMSRAIERIEARYLPRCNLVVAASEELADAYVQAYGIKRPLVAYNVPPALAELPARQGGGLNLYWRNTVIGFGQRGLEDMLVAMTRLPPDVQLYLQGGLPGDGGKVLRAKIAQLGITNRTIILPPHRFGEAVPSAARYDVGLCLERIGPRNHELTVSNKMFDYHMAGLAVIASDLPGLAAVIRSSEGGVLYQPGNPDALAAAVEGLRANPARLWQLQHNARKFALAAGNLEYEIASISGALRKTLDQFANDSRVCRRDTGL